MATLNFTPLSTTATVWFADANAFNSFLSAITVSVGASDLPAATTSTIGGVKKAATVSYSATGAVTSSYILQIDANADGVTENYEVPTKAFADNLNTRVAALETALANLITSLQNAGSLN